MSRNGGKHLGSKRRAEIYKREGRLIINKRENQKKIERSPRKRLKSKKTAKTPLMIWDDFIRNTPKGCSGDEKMQEQIPKKYRTPVPEKKKRFSRSEGYSTKKKGWVRYGADNRTDTVRDSR